MAKYYGKIGFVKYVDDGYGISTEETIEKPYKGDVLSNVRRNDVGSEKVNLDLSLTNEISIVANSFAIANFSYMRYATYMGVKWRITSAKIDGRRIILSFGGVYNGHAGPAEGDL